MEFKELLINLVSQPSTRIADAAFADTTPQYENVSITRNILRAMELRQTTHHFANTVSYYEQQLVVGLFTTYLG
jgi:hypothetical protein